MFMPYLGQSANSVTRLQGWSTYSADSWQNGQYSGYNETDDFGSHKVTVENGFDYSRFLTMDTVGESHSVGVNGPGFNFWASDFESQSLEKVHTDTAVGTIDEVIRTFNNGDNWSLNLGDQSLSGGHNSQLTISDQVVRIFGHTLNLHNMDYHSSNFTDAGMNNFDVPIVGGIPMLFAGSGGGWAGEKG